MGGGGWGRGYQLMGVPRPPGHGGRGITLRTDVGISGRSGDVGVSRALVLVPALLLISSGAWGTLLNQF